MCLDFSPFGHLLHVQQGVYALWNSLWLRTLYLSEPFVSVVSKAIEARQIYSGLQGEIADDQWEGFLNALRQEKFVTPENDRTKLAELREAVTQEKISIMYLILTQDCNQACTYCYLAKMLNETSPQIKLMSRSTIKKAIDYFKIVLGGDGTDSQIVLYGGEPTLNPNLEYALHYARIQIPDVQFVLVTNGSGMTEKVARILARYNVNVGVSVDGPREVHDTHRVFKNGTGTFDKVKQGHEILLGAGVNVSVSCTITADNAPYLEETMSWLLDDFGARGIDFNLLIGGCNSSDYPDQAADGLVKCYQQARERGLLIDRVMRRVDPFVSGNVVLHDCGGAGNQIVITPDERVGSCQAFLNSGEFFFPLRDVVNPAQHELWLSWKKRSPFNIPKCLQCEALGICGGGCFYEPFVQHGDIMEVDPVHCAHAKRTLQFLLKDLWEKENGE